MLHRFNVRTRARTDFYEITARVAGLVSSSGIRSGVCHVFVPHTTAGLTLNEHADPSVVEDITAKFDSLVPWSAPYRHSEGNAAAHIKTSLVGTCQTLIIEDGRLVLGTWQGIFLCEFDGPRNRTVCVKLTAD